MPLTTEERRARHREYMRRYRLKNPDRHPESRAYWAKYRSRLLAEQKERKARRTPQQNERVRELGRGYAKRYREKYPERAKAASDRFREKNRDVINKKRNEVIRLALEAAAGRPRPEHCEVCGDGGVISFDHCHQRGLFRGWLCSACNKVLGFVKDDPERLRKLIVYLTKSG